MQITWQELKSEVDNLNRMIDTYRDRKLEHKDMVAVSDLLAETVQMVRRKYKITSLYYLPSELKAVENVGDTVGGNKVNATWEKIEGRYRCSCCSYETMTVGNFCANCGRRMVKVND